MSFDASDIDEMAAALREVALACSWSTAEVQANPHGFIAESLLPTIDLYVRAKTPYQ